MNKKNRIILLVFDLAITSFAIEEVTTQECYYFSMFYSIADLQKEVISLEQEFEKCKESRKNTLDSLLREITFLEQENEKCHMSTEIDVAEKCMHIVESIWQKRDKCWASRIDVEKNYSSQDTTIRIRFTTNHSCNEKKTFFISYKKKGITMDSTFYFNDDYWEVTERDDSTGSYKSKTSGGSKMESLYDKQKRLINFIYVENKYINNSSIKDTLAFEHYFWEKGRLVKTIIKGVERVFTYGTPCDSVIVNPSDLHQMGQVDISSPPVYNKSFGLLPEETDHEYENFKRNPYRYYAPPSLLEKQKARCEDHKKSQKKKGNKK